MTTESNIISKKWLLLILISIAIALFLTLFNTTVRKYCCAEEYNSFSSPNGEYHVKVFRIKVFPMMMPGSAGDAPGFVRLYGKNDKILEEKDIEMVQIVEDVEWSENKVYMKLFAEWDLPTQQAP